MLIYEMVRQAHHDNQHALFSFQTPFSICIVYSNLKATIGSSLDAFLAGK